MVWAKGKSPFGQLPPSIEGVVLSARHNDSFGFLGRERFEVFIQLVLELFYVKYS